MRFEKSILAAAALATAITPVASLAGDVRPGDSLVSASAAAASPVPVAPVQRVGASMDYANAAVGGKWVLITLATGAVIWAFIEILGDGEVDVESP